jgi:spermidine synthase
MPSSGKAETARSAPSGNLPPTHPAHPASTQPDAPRHPSSPNPDYPAVTVSEHEGVLYLHLGTEWIQGGMRMGKPDALEIEYVQQMMMWTLFNPQPQHIVQLGLGAGALTKFCYRQFPEARISAIELNPAVIAICRSMFALPPNDARLNVIEIDALDFVLDRANHGTADVLQVDLYDADARGPVLDTPEFYQACADCLTPDGMLTANLFGDFVNYQKNLYAMEQVFDAVAWLPEVHDANVVAIAFKRAPELEFSTLERRAALIRRQLGLPAGSWVTGLKAWMRSS